MMPAYMKVKVLQAVMERAFNTSDPRTLEAEAEAGRFICEFEANLVYRVKSRTVRTV